MGLCFHQGVCCCFFLFYIFGAVSMVMIFAIGVINSHIEKKREQLAKEDVEEVAEGHKSTDGDEQVA